MGRSRHRAPVQLNNPITVGIRDNRRKARGIEWERDRDILAVRGRAVDQFRARHDRVKIDPIGTEGVRVIRCREGDEGDHARRIGDRRGIPVEIIPTGIRDCRLV